MDFDSLKTQVSNLTLYDLKAGVRKVQNAVMNLTDMEAKVREATNGDPWGASATLMQDISQGTHNYQQLNEIMPMIYKRFTDKTAEEWRQIYKSLQLLEFLVKNGSERVVDDARSHLSLLRMLRQFHYIDQAGKDQGINVRNRSVELVKLLSDVDTIRSERKKSRSNKNKYGGVEGGMGMGSGFSSNNRYGGFGSETGGFGGYQGEVYGDGGGFGGRETDYSSTQRRGEQFEEYDEEEEGATTSRQATRTGTSRKTGAPAVKKDPLKAKEPEQDLFDFSEEPATSAGNGKTNELSNNGLDDFGTLQAGSGGVDDDFDDFQSATSPTVAQSATTSLAALSPPPMTSTTTSHTQFAAPKPVAPSQAANMNTILSSPSPAPSNSSSIPAMSSTGIMSPQSSFQAPPPTTSYKPTGPNYYTSVNVSINDKSSNSSAFAARPTATMSANPSYTSSTSAASLGRPASKPIGASTGDAFGSLWSSASTKAGVQNKGASTNNGPNLASLAKANHDSKVWGPNAGSSLGFSTTPRPGAIAPSPNTATGQNRSNAPLGNGLDDLLG